MICADTSVIVRYLTGRPADQARRAAKVLDGPADVAISLVSVVETAHVLRTQYGVGREAVVDALLDLVRRADIEVLGLPHDDLVEALLLARSMPGRPIPDALIAIGARSAGAVPLVTFDRQMSRYGVPTLAP